MVLLFVVLIKLNTKLKDLSVISLKASKNTRDSKSVLNKLIC